MFKALTTVAMFGAMVMSAGCDAALNVLQPNTTTVLLANNSDFNVQATVIIDDDQNIPRELLEEIGETITYDLSPGETASLRRECDDLQAVVIDDADLDVVGAIGPSTSSDVLRDGDDFGCGDTITFTFDHSAVLVDFDISIAVQS